MILFFGKLDNAARGRIKNFSTQFINFQFKGGYKISDTSISDIMITDIVTIVQELDLNILLLEQNNLKEDNLKKSILKKINSNISKIPILSKFKFFLENKENYKQNNYYNNIFHNIILIIKLTIIGKNKLIKKNYKLKFLKLNHIIINIYQIIEKSSELNITDLNINDFSLEELIITFLEYTYIIKEPIKIQKLPIRICETDKDLGVLLTPKIKNHTILIPEIEESTSISSSTLKPSVVRTQDSYTRIIEKENNNIQQSSSIYIFNFLQILLIIY